MIGPYQTIRVASNGEQRFEFALRASVARVQNVSTHGFGAPATAVRP